MSIARWVPYGHDARCTACRRDDQDACRVDITVVDKWVADVKRRRKVLPLPAEASCQHCYRFDFRCVLPRIQIVIAEIEEAVEHPPAQKEKPQKTARVDPFELAVWEGLRALRKEASARQEVLERVANTLERIADHMDGHLDYVPSISSRQSSPDVDETELMGLMAEKAEAQEEIRRLRTESDEEQGEIRRLWAKTELYPGLSWCIITRKAHS